MNAKQWTVLNVSVALFSFSELFPPWLYEDDWTSAERSAGYHFVLNPAPLIKPYDEMKRLFSIREGDPEHGFSVRPDVLRLYGQRLALLFLLPGLLLSLDDRKSLLKFLLGRTILYIGLGFVGIYILYFSKYWK